jgi:hypothetical protein
MRIYIHGVSVYFSISLEEDTLQAHKKEKTIETDKKTSIDSFIALRFIFVSIPAGLRFVGG